MIPIIYPSNETEFLTRGYGALADCISCTVTEVLNGEYGLTMKYPKNGVNQEYLDIRNIIVCQPNHTTERQAFRINKVNRSMKSSITATAYQLAYDLSNYVAYSSIIGKTTDNLNLRQTAPDGQVIMVMPVNTELTIIGAQTISGLLWYHVQFVSDPATEGWCSSNYVELLMHAEYPITVSNVGEALQLLNLSAGDFAFSTDKSTVAEFALDKPASVRSWFGGKEGSIIDQYGGEWEYGFNKCTLKNKRGADNGARLSYGVNLAEYVKERTDDAYSAILPYFYKKDGDTDITVVGDSIATGYTATNKVLTLDVTDKFDSNYGKIIDFAFLSRQKAETPQSGVWKDISDTSIYVVDAQFKYAYDIWVYIENYAVTADSVQFQAVTGISQPPQGVAFPVKLTPNIQHEFKCSTNSYCRAVTISYANGDGDKISSESFTGTSMNKFNFTPPSNAVWTVFIFYPTTWMQIAKWSDIMLRAVPPVADITAQGTAYKNTHPELATDTQTITITPDLINTEVSLGDTVHVAYDNELISTRVIKTIWNVLAEKYDNLELGTVKQNIAQTIKKLR